jgi:hypothetical protein
MEYRKKEYSRGFVFLKDYKKRVSKKLRAYKKLRGCEICGYNTDGLALDFAHIDPSKKSFYMYKDGPTGSGMSKMISRLTFGSNKEKNRLRWKELKEEIRKCKVLCKNCHVVETYRNKEMHNSHKMWKVRQTKQRNYTARMMRAHTTRTLEDLFE